MCLQATWSVAYCLLCLGTKSQVFLSCRKRWGAGDWRCLKSRNVASWRTAPTDQQLVPGPPRIDAGAFPGSYAAPYWCRGCPLLMQGLSLVPGSPVANAGAAADPGLLTDEAGLPLLIIVIDCKLFCFFPINTFILLQGCRAGAHKSEGGGVKYLATIAHKVLQSKRSDGFWLHGDLCKAEENFWRPVDNENNSETFWHLPVANRMNGSSGGAGCCRLLPACFYTFELHTKLFMIVPLVCSLFSVLLVRFV